VIKVPNQKFKSVKNEVVSQIDLMPTILNLVGVKTEFPMFGRDVFGRKTERYFSVVNDLPELTVLDNLIYFIDPKKAINNERCYLQGNNLLSLSVKDCAEMLATKQKEQKYARDLIRYNLFNHFY
jgi:phosphoglycerol transferase MdoB-like AlkP superfamily enzyme